jgi:hypoxanthine phosphoribosyltransferase
LGVEFYVGVAETLSEPVLTQRVSADVQDKKALLVDDVTDTGKSLQLAKEHPQQQGVRELRIATLYRKPFSVTRPDYCEKKTRCWVVFPWDFKETIRNILRKHQDKCVINVEVEKLVTAGLPKKRIEEFLKEEPEAGNC